MLIVEAQNIHQVGNFADYVVRVKVNREVIALVYVRGHDRRDGWRELLRQIADAAEEKPGGSDDRKEVTDR